MPKIRGSALGRRAVARAATFIGTMEDPVGSNHGLRVDGWIRRATGLNGGIPWCACFVWCMFQDVGAKQPVQEPAAVASWEDYADAHGFEVKRPFRGDVICYSWNGETPEPRDHIGFVERVLALPWPRNGRRFFLRTVEGNTGDGVFRRWRWVNPRTVVFIRIP